MGIWEALMMAAFGFSWPMQIMKTYKTKNPAGKSLAFLFLIFFGYGAGIIHKLTVHYNWVFWIYLLNLIMVGTDLTLTLYYKHRIAKSGKENA